jgi:hypothetical protein
MPEMITCSCGDIRPLGEMCHICGTCQMGCCMCAEKIRDLEAMIAEYKRIIATLSQVGERS